jgi:hypothetical protein
MRRVGRLAARQIESDGVARRVRFGVDFRGETATERPSTCFSCPPIGAGGRYSARTIVESNIWIRWADELMEASASKKASNTPAFLKRSKRCPTLF